MNTPSQVDTSAVANQLALLITAGTTGRELVATVARVFPDLERRELVPCRTRPQPPRNALPGSTEMASLQTTQVDRVARSLKRLGFRMTRVGRSFTIIDNSGEPAAGSKTRMSLAEIELWIGEHIRRL